MSDSNSSETRQRRSNRCVWKKEVKDDYKTGPFSNEEKELLLSALYTYGPNVDKITPLIPSRSREQVRDFLTSWFRRVKKVPIVLSERDHQTIMIKEPIELWLEKIKKETKIFIDSSEGMLHFPWYPYALGYIAKFENHPPPPVTGGVDFRKLYEFLESMLNGNVPKDLSFCDALFILSSLRKLKLRLEKVDFHKDETHLKRTGAALQARTYKRIKKEDPDEEQTEKHELENLLSSKIMNPLNMPMELLCVKDRLKSQSLI